MIYGPIMVRDAGFIYSGIIRPFIGKNPFFNFYLSGLDNYITNILTAFRSHDSRNGFPQYSWPITFKGLFEKI